MECNVSYLFALNLSAMSEPFQLIQFHCMNAHGCGLLFTVCLNGLENWTTIFVATKLLIFIYAFIIVFHSDPNKSDDGLSTSVFQKYITFMTNVL